MTRLKRFGSFLWIAGGIEIITAKAFSTGHGVSQAVSITNYHVPFIFFVEIGIILIAIGTYMEHRNQ